MTSILSFMELFINTIKMPPDHFPLSPQIKINISERERERERESEKERERGGDKRDINVIGGKP